MRSENWKGLITNASPYALPAGAATEQVNLQCHVPGQLTTRGGMQDIVFANYFPTGEVRDIFPYRYEGVSKIIALRPDGTIVSMRIPSVGAPPPAPVVSTMSPSSGTVRSNYIGQFFADGGEPPA